MVSMPQSAIGFFLRWCFGREFLDIIRGEETLFPSITTGPPVRICLLNDIYDVSDRHGQVVWFLWSKHEQLRVLDDLGNVAYPSILVVGP